MRAGRTAENASVLSTAWIWDLHFDPLSIIKLIEDPDTPEGQWVEVPYAVSFVAFGERQ